MSSNMWMADTRNRFRLALEPVARLRIARRVFGKNLDRHRAVKPSVARTVNFAHASDADRIGALLVPFCRD